MEKPKSVQKSPYKVKVEKGKTYFWCSCGLSKKQPFCDSSHKGTEFNPIVYKAEKAKKVYFCICKQTNNRPFCDGSHEKY